jgi:hypothetical protein
MVEKFSDFNDLSHAALSRRPIPTTRLASAPQPGHPLANYASHLSLRLIAARMLGLRKAARKQNACTKHFLAW